MRSFFTVDGRRRQDFADPIGHHLEAVILGNLGHALAPPADQVRHDDFRIPDEVNLRLHQDPPAAGASPSLIERTAQLYGQPAFRDPMSSGGPGLGMEFAADDLAYPILGQGEQLLVRRGLNGGMGKAHAAYCMLRIIARQAIRLRNAITSRRSWARGGKRRLPLLGDAHDGIVYTARTAITR